LTDYQAEKAGLIARAREGELLVVVGPTASGKTALAIDLCEALDGEIISADSVQIYRGFDAGSGKPAAEELARVPHHIVDVANPDDAFDAQRFVELAENAMLDIRARGRTPIVCGGTFLWVRALIHGLAPAPPADEAIRARHRAIAEAEGRLAIHTRLAAVDPVSAARLEPNDLVRTSRALEVYELSGKPLSEWHAEHGFREARHKAVLVGVDRPRDELDRRISDRVRGFFQRGWIDEVRDLSARGFGASRAMGSVGYRQVKEHLEGQIRGDDLHEAVVRVTRVFVRRQRTWLRDQPVLWVSL
jgi:tRNA dimethylallyltransferase